MDSRTMDGMRDRARRPVRTKRYSRRAFGEERRPPKRLFTPEIKRFLKDWLIRRRDNPYPNRDEKKTLAIQTGLTYIQVCNWFANWRRKLKNAGKEPQRKTWGHLIKTYNNQVQGNVEHFSICSDDSIWHEMENNSSDFEQKTYEYDRKAYDFSYKPKEEYVVQRNHGSDIQTFYISSTTEPEPENPFAQHKYKNHIMEKYLKDCQKPDNVSSKVNGETEKPSMISRWLESAVNFKPSQNNYLDWTYEKIEKKRPKKTANNNNTIIINNNDQQQHGKEELDAAEALTTLANAHKF
ncbi:PREDICTED: homeobox protein Mohawk [Nicrophorus vespilloides]|uniref:Homeobox protein Mohawk n=1 Tax=Nicrophorus vespilloides TaxID=110193 RepID=A0ABM1MJZ7_NICVS|nr:PREDICTED: homeobox protein Mohawk [Nicrophorus vespilloides]XP_017774897.1 PREDICTED: homeobox protein Mohawk [Nicrophorus vespilloides]